MERSVSAIAVTPIKGFALAFPKQVVLGPNGVEDTRRFRMLFQVDGCDAHEEDAWLGRRVRIRVDQSGTVGLGDPVEALQ
jgi:hypothetical protein